VTDHGRVELLAADHDVAAFDCGSEAQTLWLRRYALQADRADTAKVYVICRRGTRQVVGYYALAAGSVSHEQVPPRLTKGIGRYPIPVIILTRLGVDLGVQRKGVGSELVRDALLQAASVARKVGVRAIVIHAETPGAAAFYRRITSAFQESPTDPLHLVMLLKDLRKTIGDAVDLVDARLALADPANAERVAWNEARARLTADESQDDLGSRELVGV
jgi:GNAT superfamily N-acetyltransferase